MNLLLLYLASAVILHSTIKENPVETALKILMFIFYFIFYKILRLLVLVFFLFTWVSVRSIVCIKS